MVATLLAAACTAIAVLSLQGDRDPARDVLTSFLPVVVAGLLLCALPAIAFTTRRRGGRILIAALLSIGLATAGSRIVPEYRRPIPQAMPGDGQVLRILTFNAWRKNGAPEDTIAAIAAANADIVLLQEAESAVGDRLGELAGLYPYRTDCPRGHCVETILSKRPLADPRGRILDDRGWPTAPMITYARTTAPDGRPVQVATLHYTWPLPGKGQEIQRAALIDGLRGVDKTDLIVGGDMNLTPWSFALARQDAALAPLVRQTRGLFSFPSHRAGGWRALLPPILAIDQLYAGPAWRQVSVKRLPATGSDHYPVLVTLARHPPG